MKPMFKARIWWVTEDKPNWSKPPTKKQQKGLTKIRITDAREITAEKAVEKVLQAFFDAGWISDLDGNIAAKKTGMTARVVNGKVRVRRAEK